MNGTNCSCGGSGGGVGGGTTGYGGGNGARYLGPPPFLTKTYNIVDDPNTNSVISWSLSGDSFIIRNHHQFSAEILPIHFKHSNLASFVYQLNSYGFRKIGVANDWEYENPNFQAGKRYLLANIRRRKRKTYNNNNNNNDADIKIISPEILMNEINESKLEIEKLQLQIKAFQEKLEIIYNNIPRLMMTEKTNGKEKINDDDDDDDDDDQAIKKRRFDTLTSENTEKDPGFKGFDDQDKEDTNIPLLSENKAVINGNLELLAKNGGDDYNFWNKIMLEDDEVECESINNNIEAVVEMANKQAEIAMDLEGLIANVEAHGERVIVDLN